MNYPEPKSNPVCQCKDNSMNAFWCKTGHMLECHYPYNCTQAACSHLRKYDFTQEDIKPLEDHARRASEAGLLQPYVFDEHGNATVHTKGESTDQSADELGKKIATAINAVQKKRSEPQEPQPNEAGGDLCTRCGDPIDHDDPHMYCSRCA